MPRLKIGVLISGSGTNLQSLIDSAKSGEINGEIAVVISDKEDAYGLERARMNGIDAVFVDAKRYENRTAFNDEIVSVLKKHGVVLVVLAGYLKILSPEFISEYRNKIINIHPSLIPSFCGKGYYGLKVHESVIEYGAKITGATVHFVDEEADAGPIILQESVEVYWDDTPEVLQQRVLKIEHRLLPAAVKYYCDGRIETEGRKVKIREE
ncbi:MAG TPA: phosphoribosylglycinamide formyltransferase [Clostridiales bacterium]|nr:phosphoribosylglycinamide formyltransferase [Clostridiales bacterium]